MELKSHPVLDTLSKCIVDQLLLRDTDHPVFHGSYDWHSAVHGHWAALWLARTREDEAGATHIIERLDGPEMASEFQYLESHPFFERPYGRAWLLRLGALVEKHGNTQILRAGLNQTATSIEDWLTLSDHPCAPEYNNACWAVWQLADWYRHINDQASLRRCQRWVSRHMNGFTAHPQEDAERAEFFSYWSLQTSVIGAVLGPAALRTHLSHTPADVRPIQDLRNAHHLGVNPCRAWGCAAAYLATRDPAWREATAQHLRAAVDLHPQWAHKTIEYTHWVPQFTVLALDLASPFYDVTEMS